MAGGPQTGGLTCASSEPCASTIACRSCFPTAATESGGTWEAPTWKASVRAAMGSLFYKAPRRASAPASCSARRKPAATTPSMERATLSRIAVKDITASSTPPVLRWTCRNQTKCFAKCNAARLSQATIRTAPSGRFSSGRTLLALPMLIGEDAAMHA
ncbi:unnamed protein product [Symbiodinium necroappetens]|uniref:Uncharacterized protein n=1 Tax=Symbiodinium necroappetens TaxID=1628268 RepID=A0A812K286_9DINO|nr:unnamed protein product [Symbiodinium necroappetens]